MSDLDELLKVVPPDEAEALSFRDIHRRYGKWSPTFVRCRLNDLVEVGAVKKKTKQFRPGPVGAINLYYVAKK